MKYIAVFLITLVVLLPINTTYVIAASSISDVKVYGMNALEDYRKPVDFTYVEASAKIDDIEVKPENIKFGIDNFHQCIPDTSYSVCQYQSTETYLSTGIQYYTIKLLDDDGSELRQYTGTYFVDGYEPIVDSVSIPSSYYGEDNVTISYKVTDKLSATSAGQCSGISNVEIVRSDVLKTVTLDTSNCVVSGNIVIQSKLIATGSGTFDVCLRATDRLGHMSNQTCSNLNLDLDNPTLYSYRLLNQDDEEFTYISKNQNSVKFVINISDTDSGVNKNSVKAKFTELHPSNAGFVNGICTGSDELVKCSWEASIDLNNSKTVTIPIYAEDNSGNVMNVTVSKSILIDNDAPQVVAVQTEYYYNGTSYVREINNTIIAIFQEAGSGLDENDVYLNLYKINGNTKQPADNCSGTICYWYDVDVTTSISGEFNVHVDPETTDVSGNRVEGNLSFEFISLTGVGIDSYNWTAYGKFSIYNLSYLVMGDNVLFNFTISSPYSPLLTAYADFTQISGYEYNKTSGSCIKIEDEFNCLFAAYINYSGSKSATFTFIDFVNNNVTQTITFDIKYEENATADYWSHSVKSVSPKQIDRQTTTLINHRVYSSIGFTPNVDVDEISIELLECKETKNGTGKIYDVNSIKTNNTDQWLKVTLAAIKFNGTDTLEINCTYEIIALIQDKFIYIEKEDVIYSVGFYNMPLGELSDSVKSEIKRINNSWLIKQEWLDQAMKIIRMYDTLCTVVNWLNQIKNILAAIRDILCIYPPMQAPAKEIGDAANKGEGATKSLWKSVNRFCKINSCLLIYWLEDSEEYGESVKKFTTQLDKFGINIESSLPLSMLFLCIKGIITNLQSARIIECQYLGCLKDDVASGKPIQVCTMVRGYMQCKWVYGQLFQLIPFAAVFSQFAQAIDKALTNPAAAVNMVTGIVCHYACKTPSTCGMCTLCEVFTTLNMIVDLLKDLEQVSKDRNFFKISDGVCEQVLGTADS